MEAQSRPSMLPVLNNEVHVNEEREHIEHTWPVIGPTSDQTLSGTIVPNLEPPETSPNHEGKEPVADTEEVRLTFRDINPAGPILFILSKRNSLVILCSSGERRSYTL